MIKKRLNKNLRSKIGEENGNQVQPFVHVGLRRTVLYVDTSGDRRIVLFIESHVGPASASEEAAARSPKPAPTPSLRTPRSNHEPHREDETENKQKKQQP